MAAMQLSKLESNGKKKLFKNFDGESRTLDRPDAENASISWKL